MPTFDILVLSFVAMNCNAKGLRALAASSSLRWRSGVAIYLRRFGLVGKDFTSVRVVQCWCS